MQILLIEDNRADARILEIMLSQIETLDSYDLKWVNSLAEGLDLMAKGNTYDVILTDLGLPDSYGIETLKQVKSGSSDIPVIVLSGDDDEARHREIMGLGAADCLSKNYLDEVILQRALSQVVSSPA